MITNELITNSIKYAFSSATALGGEGAAAGAVEVEMSREGEHYLLAVSDNGSGETDGSAAGTGFGTCLVGMLVQQLEGEASQENTDGLRTEINFSTTR